ncbi:MAG: hypothetical protein U5K76_04985 [Woeseiaceae bacterium]|nr:hypothetical protein [Woeseiaceae bacterium]
MLESLAFDNNPQNLLYLAGGAFAAGWLVAKVSAYLGRRFTPSERDPRDDRIRSLNAELRIERNDKGKLSDELDGCKKELEAAKAELGRQAARTDELNEQIGKLRADLRESVKKTDELRNELSDRAEENLRSTVKLREVETELSVARASTDLMSTGVLDYDVDGDDEEAAVFKAGS